MSDTKLIQDMLDAAASGLGDRRVQLEAREYRLGPSGAGAWCLRIPHGRSVELFGRGPDTILRQVGGMPGSVRAVHIDGTGSRIADLSIDSEQQSYDGQRHGLFVAGPGCLVERVMAAQMSGDGFYVYGENGEGWGGDGARFVQCSAPENKRNGLTIGGGSARSVRVENCRFENNGAQQFDCEPARDGTIHDLRVINCVLDSGDSGDYALTLGGSDPSHPATMLEVSGCQIRGPVNIVWAEWVRLARCVASAETDKPALSIWRQSNLVTVESCEFSSSHDQVVYVAATSGESAPRDLSIQGCRIQATMPGAHGVRLNGVRSAAIRGCEIVGSGATVSTGYPAGITVRAIDTTSEADEVLIDGNSIHGWGRCGVTVGGNRVTLPSGGVGRARIRRVRLVGNRIAVDTPYSIDSITEGFILDDGSDVIVHLEIGRNQFGATIAERHRVQRAPSDDRITVVPG